MNESTKAWIVMICIGIAISPFIVYMAMDIYDSQKQINYYQTSIMNRLKTESCSDLNASRSIYDPAHKGDLLPFDSMVDEAWKEKCS